MLAQERQREILNRVASGGSVRVADLAREMSVTEETIRRDLERLDQQGRLVRIHGGALPLEQDRRDLPLGIRETVNADAKRRIAAAAARHIREGDVIGLDASSTARELARALSDIPLTVVTNSFANIACLTDRLRTRVISTGGVLDTASLSYLGAIAEFTLSKFHVNKLFFSCQGVDPQRGLSVTADEHAGIKRRMLDISDTAILLADSTKFGVQAVEFFAPLDELDLIITDALPPRGVQEACQAAGVEIEIA